MNLSETISIKPSVLYFGTPVVLVSTLNPDKTTNISPISSAWALDNRVILGLSKYSQAFSNLQRHPELVINVPDANLWEQIESIASTTGKNPVPEYKAKLGYRFEEDKFSLAGLSPLSSECILPNRIENCPLQLEANMINYQQFSNVEEDGQLNACIIETRVIKVHAHKNIIIPNSNNIDTLKWKPLFYIFRHYFTTGNRLGFTFKDEVLK